MNIVIQVQALADVSKPFYRQYQELTRTYCRDSEVGTNDPEEHNGDMNTTQTQSHTQSHSHRSSHSSTGYQRQVGMIGYTSKRLCYVANVLFRTNSHKLVLHKLEISLSIGYFLAIYPLYW